MQSENNRDALRQVGAETHSDACPRAGSRLQSSPRRYVSLVMVRKQQEDAAWLCDYAGNQASEGKGEHRDIL